MAASLYNCTETILHDMVLPVDDFITNTRVIQKVLLCTKYYVISNAYPYLVYSNLFTTVS